MFRNRAKSLFLCSLLCGCGATSSDILGSSPPAPALAIETGGESPLVLEPSASDDRLLVDDQPATLNLLANDTHEQARVRPFSQTGTAGGQATVGADGLLNYVPPAGNAPFVETFQYTVENAAGSSQASITVQRSRTVYVKNNGANGNGSKASPFSTLKAALDEIGTGPAQIFILPGNNNQPIGLEVPTVTLWEGQHIQGTDANNLPLFACQFQAARTDCSLVNLQIAGIGNGPLISIPGSNLISSNQPKVVFSNLLLTNHVGDGINLQNAFNVELTQITAINLNRTEGTAALVIKDPAGLIKASNWTVTTNPRGAMAVSNGVASSQVVQVAMNGLTLRGVNNPAQLQCNAGNTQFFLLKVACNSDDLTGTLVKADVSGNAQVDAYVNDVDLIRIGEKTVALDWTYREDSKGTLRMGATRCDSALEASQPRNNPLRFATRDRVQAAYCTSRTQLSPANPVTLDAHDTSILRARVEKYTYESGGGTEIDHPFYFNAYDQSKIYSRLRDGLGHVNNTGNQFDIRSWNYYFFKFYCDPDARQRIEKFPSYYQTTSGESFDGQVYDPDNVLSDFQWTGWATDIDLLTKEVVNERVNFDDSDKLFRYPGQFSYSDADLDSLGIPRFEGFKVP